MEENNFKEQSRDYSNKKILVVEDIESNYKLLIALLKNTKAEIVLIEDGSKAVDYCRQHNDVNLILMDIMLPVMNGIEATKKIKEINKDIPIVAQTAYAMAGDREKCLEAGCDDYIPKPISRTALFDLVAKYLDF